MLSVNKKKIIQDSIVRKRLNRSNFKKHNVISKNISYIFCVPINGMSANSIQDIRNTMNRYGFIVNQYTTKAFMSTLKINGIAVERSNLSNFYLGQMLVNIVELPASCNFSTYKKQQMSFLLTLENYFKTRKNANLLYITNLHFDNKKIVKPSIVVNSIVGNISKDIDTYFGNNKIAFSNINNNIVSLLSFLLFRIIFLLSLLHYKFNNK